MNTVGKAAALAGSALIAGVGVLAIAPSMVDVMPDQQAVAAEAPAAASQAGGVTAVRNVQGSFSFDQNVVSSNSSISQIFSKAASSLCESLATYGAIKADAITVAAGGNSLSATVDEMADEDGATSFLMGCACSSNVAGGGAVMNAHASGVTLESVAKMIGALS